MKSGNDRLLVTVIQERLDNATLTVRADGEVIGSVIQDAKHKWIVRKSPPPEPHTVESLRAAVEWLLTDLPQTA